MIKAFFKNILIKPLSILWESLYKMRRWGYNYGVFRREYFEVPIVSVGNLSFGGTGKTPTTLWLIDFFEKLNRDVLVLTRGYKGELENSSGLLKAGQKFYSNPAEFGDEPLLISQSMKRGGVVVGKRRSDNLKKYFSEVLPDVVVLDDGFQHLQLFRDFNIVLFDALLPLERYQTAPMGYLREGLTALKDANAILITRSDQVSLEKYEELVDLIQTHLDGDIPIAKVRYLPVGLYNSFDEKVYSMDELGGKRLFAMTGIASPESFYNILNEHNAELVGKKKFPDHHSFSTADINEVLIESVKEDATIVVTEKDMIKIKKLTKDSRVLYLKISLEFVSGQDKVESALKNVLKLDSY